MATAPLSRLPVTAVGQSPGERREGRSSSAGLGAGGTGTEGRGQD